jgi:fructose-1,6-bisphosphatase/inositol monophosphatase family enzyme
MYQERIDFIQRLALEAGKLALEGFGQSKQIPKESGDCYDIATQHDMRTKDPVKRLNRWDCAAGNIPIREAGGLAPFDFQGRAVFPEYVGRLLDGDGGVGFTSIAASSLEVFEEPLKRILSAAGLLAED